MTNGVIIRFANGSFNVIAAMSRMKQGSLKQETVKISKANHNKLNGSRKMNCALLQYKNRKIAAKRLIIRSETRHKVSG